MTVSLLSTAYLSPDKVYRYRLGREWDSDLPTCGWVMLNPSTADATEDDPTIRRCVSFACGWGYGSIVVVNLFALRATNPGQLKVHPDPVGKDNDRHIADAVREVETVICAWGTHGVRVTRANKVLEIIRRYRACPEVRCLGVTQAGSPRHPLYVKSDRVSVPFSGGVT